MNIRNTKRKPMNKGFSLIELLIALTVVGILSAIAYPAYHQYVAQSRRTDGQAALLDLAQRMERYYSENHTYATATIATAVATDVLSSNQSPEGWYTLTITAQNGSSFTIQATPNGAQATTDTRCQSLTLNNLGVKGIADGASTPTGTAAQCWGG